MSPDFLTLDEVLEIHRDQIERYGGAAGIRDLGLLQSALAQPSATFGGQYLHADLHEMAAAYLYHLVQNHPFLDGNKSTIGMPLWLSAGLLATVSESGATASFEKGATCRRKKAPGGAKRPMVVAASRDVNRFRRWSSFPLHPWLVGSSG